QPGMQLAIIGDGEERVRLEALARAGTEAGTIRFIGRAEDDLLHRYLASCDVLCLPSRERTEAFGIVLLEAMRYGKPLVVSDLKGSGVTWVARPGQNALAAPPGDVPAWREALASLAASPARQQLLGHLGRERFLRDFDIGSVATRVHAVYEHAMRV